MTPEQKRLQHARKAAEIRMSSLNISHERTQLERFRVIEAQLIDLDTTVFEDEAEKNHYRILLHHARHNISPAVLALDENRFNEESNLERRLQAIVKAERRPLPTHLWNEADLVFYRELLENSRQETLAVIRIRDNVLPRPILFSPHTAEQRQDQTPRGDFLRPAGSGF